MKKFKFSGILFTLLMAAVVFAQAQTSEKSTGQSAPPTTMCPMMGMMGNAKEGKPTSGNMQEMMRRMPQRMVSMFSLSAEEIGARLTEKKAELGLSDTQVKEVADLIASSGQQKIETKMQTMMGRMQAGQTNCPCMQNAAK